MKIELHDKVVTDLYSNEIFEVVGIREHQLELRGDWSGGTHNVDQTSWYDRNKCVKYIELHEFVSKLIKC